MNTELIEQLLHQEETESLDFKSDQYKFAGEVDFEKAKLLKDILAFANSWCSGDAHILVGVKEIKGGRSQIIALSEQLDDADLQEFVNKKLNRPIAFSYRAVNTPEGTIAMITIPRQERPFHLKKDFGNLKANTVYVRRGSSTDIASLDEVARMGQNRHGHDASLDLSFVSRDGGEALGRNLAVRSHILRFDAAAIPSYGVTNSPFGLNLPFDFQDNRNFYREYAEYQRKCSVITGVRFSVRNTGSTLLRNLRIKAEFDLPGNLLVIDNDDYPEEPIRRTQYMVAGLRNFNSPLIARRSVSVKKQGNRIYIVAQMLDVQPKDQVISADRIYFGGKESGQINFEAKVFSDDLPNPGEFDFSVSVEAITGQLDISTVISNLDRDDS